MKLIFDAHLDLGWNAISWKRDLTKPVSQINAAEIELNDNPARGHATTSLPEMRKGGVAACLATLIARAPTGPGARFEMGDLDFRTPEMAFAAAHGQLSYYRILARQGEVRMISSRDGLDDHWRQWEETPQREGLPVGLILAMEGCDSVVDAGQLTWWHELGLRCASLVHYGRNVYAGGTGDDSGLSERGRELLTAFEKVGMILDVTHLCDRSFFDAVGHFGGPVLASHQNCRALVSHPRQFSDQQLRLLFDRGGVVGVACDAWMLHEGWQHGLSGRELVGLDAIGDHIDHLCQLAGNARQVAIGSDLDGGFGREQTPLGLDTIADLQKLSTVLADRGYPDDEINRFFCLNWLDFLRTHLPRGDHDVAE